MFMESFERLIMKKLDVMLSCFLFCVYVCVDFGE